MIIKTEPAATGPMNKGEAKALTDRIRQAVDNLHELVMRARDGKAWKALGYTTWDDYVQTEFGMSKRRADQLLEKAEVLGAIEDVTGKMGNAFPISKRDVDAVKEDLPAVAAEIKTRIAAGEEPNKAASETVAAKRAEKEKKREERKAEQAKNDAYRDENRAALSPKVQQQEQARAAAKAKKPEALPAEDRIAELEQNVAALEKENADLKARVKKFGEMEVEFRKGGFEEVIRGKDEVIATLKTRVERESADKVSWKKSSDMWRKRAEDSGWSNDVAIDIETGVVGRA